LGGRNPVEVVSAQIRGGVDVIQLREKQSGKRARLEMAFRLRELTRQTETLFIVNDDVDIALIAGADGVHLGQDDIPVRHARSLVGEKLIGVSTHCVEQIREAVASGADYIGVGPIFDSGTKETRESLVGLELLRTAREICPIPYVAIGGVGKDNIHLVVGAGCRRAAVISDILTAADVEERCRHLKGMLS